jgi:hypothetical protein
MAQWRVWQGRVGLQEGADPGDFGRCQGIFCGIEQGGDELFRGIVEEGGEETADGAAFCAFR